MNDVVIAGAGPNGLMLANELALAGVRPIVLEPLAEPNPQRRANGITGQAVRLLDHRGLYGVVSGTPDPPQPSPWAMFAAMALDLTAVPDPQHFMVPVQQPRLVQILAERVGSGGADYYVARPAGSPDEVFHEAVSSFLLEWATERRIVPHTVHIVGDAATPRTLFEAGFEGQRAGHAI